MVVIELGVLAGVVCSIIFEKVLIRYTLNFLLVIQRYGRNVISKL